MSPPPSTGKDKGLGAVCRWSVPCPDCLGEKGSGFWNNRMQRIRNASSCSSRRDPFGCLLHVSTVPPPPPEQRIGLGACSWECSHCKKFLKALDNSVWILEWSGFQVSRSGIVYLYYKSKMPSLKIRYLCGYLQLGSPQISLPYSSLGTCQHCNPQSSLLATTCSGSPCCECIFFFLG